MIEYRDFERLAARYSDGEATEGEDQSVRDFLLADRRAQGDLQRLDAERQWISRAFARRPEDLSRLVIKVRQRNPHRRRSMSPAISLVVQFGVLLLMAYSLFELHSELAPPSVTVLSTHGHVDVERVEFLDPKSSVPLNRPLTTGQDSAARLQVGVSDTVIVAAETELRIRTPRPGARHFVALDAGEVWCRFTDAQSGFAVELAGLDGSGSGDIPEVNGRKAEINVGSGDAVAALMQPRGTPNGLAAVAVVRLLSGNASYRWSGGETALEPGCAYLVTSGDAAPSKVDDPDAQHYRRLRLDRSDSFKRSWDWINPEFYPLGRDIVTYDLWKNLVAIADKVTEGREAALARDGGKEISDFKAEVNRRMAAAVAAIAARKPVPGNGTASAESYQRTLMAENSPRKAEVAAGLASLHLDSGPLGKVGPDLLAAFGPEAAAMIKAWEAGDRDFWSLTVATDSTQLLTVLSEMSHTSASRMDSAARRAKAVENARVALEAEQRDLEKATADLAARIASPNRDPDRKKREEAAPELEKTRAEISRLRSLEQEENLKRVAAKPFLDEIDRLNRERGPRMERLRKLEADKAHQQELLDANGFRPESLTRVESKISLTEETIKTNRGLKDQQERDLALLNTAAAARAAELTAARAADEQRQAELAAAVGAETEAAGKRDTASLELAEAEKVLAAREAETAAAKEALDRLPEGRRKGSDEEKAYLAAAGARDSALAAAQAVREVYEAALSAHGTANQVKLLAVQTANAASQALSAAKTANEEAVKAVESKTGEIEVTTGTLASLDTRLSEAKKELEDLLKLRAEREAIEAAIRGLVDQITPLKAEIAGLDAGLARQQEQLRPIQDEHSEILKELEKLPAQKEKADGLERQIAQWEIAEVNERKAGQRVVGAQNAVIDGWLQVFQRMAEYGVTIGSGSREVPASAITGIRERAAIVAEMNPDGTWKPTLYERPLDEATARGTAVIGELAAFVAREEELNADSLARSRAVDLATAWLAAVASDVRTAALADQHRRVSAFRQHASDADGFASVPHGAGTVAALLEAARAGSSGLPGPELTEEQARGLLQYQWNKFVDVGIVSDNERAAAESAAGAARRPPAVQINRCYLPLMREDPTGPAIRDLSSSWTSHLITVIGEPAFRTLANQRR